MTRNTKGMSWLARCAVAGLMVAGLSGCEVLLPKDTPGAEKGGLIITEGTKKRPVMVARACYQAPDRFEAMVDRLDDLVMPVKGPVPMGNGSLEIAFESAEDEPILALEAGGTLLIEGVPGESYQLVVKNVSRSPLELRVRVDGRDLFAGQAEAWDHVGAVIEAGQTLVFDQGWKSTGEAYPLQFVSVPGLSAPLNFQADGQTGLIQLGVFALDQQDRMTTAVPEPGWKKEAIPFTPTTSPYQYR